MSRYTVDTFTSAAVAPNGGILDVDRTVIGNALDIVKIKVVPSIGTGTNVFEIYKKSARQAADLLLITEPFTGLLYVDPPDSGGLELNEGSVAPYYDDDETLKIHLRITNNHTVAKTYDITITYEALPVHPVAVLGVPEGLVSDAQANGLHILTGCLATRFNETVSEAEFRATFFASGQYGTFVDMRTVAEGGSWVPNGTTRLQITGIYANSRGGNYEFDSAADGRWFYAWRLKNAIGWSLWTDGNTTPSHVTQYVDTKDAAVADSGPPEDWEVWLEDGPTPNTVIVHATRPKTNGANLFWWAIQVKDADQGSWRLIDANVGAAVTVYDGSAVSHSVAADGTISKASSGWGTAQEGDLIVMDYRGGNFDINHCHWCTIIPGGIGTTTLASGFHPAVTTDIRIKIVKPPWAWITEGYLGDQPNSGLWPGPGAESTVNNGLGLGWIKGDESTQEFVSTPIPIPAAVTNPEARVWFENFYARSDGNLIHSTGKLAGSGVFTPRLFKNFNDRGLWLPVYPNANYGTLAFGVDGSSTAAVAGASESQHAGAVGIRGRFRFVGDTSFSLICRAKWTNVIFPTGLAAADRLALGIWFYQGVPMYGMMMGAILEIVGTDAAHVNFGNAGVSLRVSASLSYGTDIFAAGYDYSSGAVGKPPNGSTIEIRATWSNGNFYTHFAMTSEEYRIGGIGAYTARSNDIGFRVGQGYYRGLTPFIGWVGNCRLNGATATLTEFDFTTGLGEIV